MGKKKKTKFEYVHGPRMKMFSRKYAIMAKGYPRNISTGCSILFLRLNRWASVQDWGSRFAIRIITSYSGSIEVESQLGEGTSFIIRLPAKLDGELKNAPQKLCEEKVEHPRVRGRVLLVDDEFGVRETLKRVLETEHEVVTAASGKEGRKVLETDTDFDVILCDLMMLGCSGMDLYDWLIDRHPSLAQRTVFMTGGVFTSRVKSFLKRIPNLLLEKPFEKGVLESTVQELVKSSKVKH